MSAIHHDEGPMSPYETLRARQIHSNNERMRALGVLQSASSLHTIFKVTKRPGRRPSQKSQDDCKGSRSSARLAKVEPEYNGIGSEDEEEYDVAARKTEILCFTAVASRPLTPAENMKRCQSQARGSLYDSHAGICCHFCRQKKLCGEEGCPRCSHRDLDQQCIGKSECSMCHSARGRFCRACLLVRYGETLEEVRDKQATTEGWLCPHCVEEKYPKKGWICNSSICLKLRGMKPTGIAIFEAQKRGFPSVGHLLQAQLLQNGRETA
eukprot:jgi/Botrbrau1/15747/Bobra.4_1s0115.1